MQMDFVISLSIQIPDCMDFTKQQRQVICHYILKDMCLEFLEHKNSIGSDPKPNLLKSQVTMLDSYILSIGNI